jgi:hypothetical protein
VVSLVTPTGSGAYSVPVSAQAYGGTSLPLFAYNVFGGITSRYYIHNPMDFDLNGTLLVTSQYGQAVGTTGGAFNRAYTFKFIIPSHTTYIFDPSTNPIPVGSSAPIPQGYYGYAYFGSSRASNNVTGSTANPIYITTLMQEYRLSDNFSTVFNFNGLATYESSTLYIPGVYKDAYGGFFTGMSFSPGTNSSANLIVKLTYYDTKGNVVLVTTSPNLYYGSMYSIYTGAISGLPDGFAGSAVATITAADPLDNNTMQVMINTEGSPVNSSVTRNGAYMGLANDYAHYGYQVPFPFSAPYNPQVTTLPVIANGGYGGFFTGITIQNLLDSFTSFTVTYKNIDGSNLSGVTTKSYTLAPHASLFIYQGSTGGEGLPSNWVGTAVIAVTSAPPTFNSTSGSSGGPYFSLLAQANVQSPFAFFTLAAPGNLVN